jgi:hypothetical protein
MASNLPQGRKTTLYGDDEVIIEKSDDELKIA